MLAIVKYVQLNLTEIYLLLWFAGLFFLFFSFFFYKQAKWKKRSEQELAIQIFAQL